MAKFSYRSPFTTCGLETEQAVSFPQPWSLYTRHMQSLIRTINPYKPSIRLASAGLAQTPRDDVLTSFGT